MAVLTDFYRSTIGKKVVMALTGLVLVGFVISHMAGNLKMFAGADPDGVYKLDHYAHLLRTLGADFVGYGTALWAARGFLLLCLVLHVVSAIQLADRNRTAKPIRAQQPRYGSSNAASRTMLFGGLFLLCFIIFHILHFTTGHTHFHGFVEGQVYANVYHAFQNMPLVAFYVLSMVFLCMHLYHGTWSVFQTLGVDSPLWNSGLRVVAKTVAIILFVGFSAVPVSVALDIVPAPAQAVVAAH